jgi:hypothetical protein
MNELSEVEALQTAVPSNHRLFYENFVEKQQEVKVQFLRLLMNPPNEGTNTDRTHQCRLPHFLRTSHSIINTIHSRLYRLSS